MADEVEETSRDNNPQQTSNQQKSYPKMTFKDYFLLAISIGLAFMVACAAIKSMDRADVKPSEILTNPGEHSVFEEGGWLDE